MSFASKIILALIIVASLALAFLSMYALKVHDQWRTAYENAKDQLARSEIDTLLLADNEDEIALSGRRMYSPGAAEPDPGVRQLTQRLQGILADRGRVWYGATPMRVDADTSAATVQLGPFPDPPNIQPGMTVYVFDERDVRVTQDNPVRGQYLGEFTVTAANGPNIELRPSMQMSQREQDRLLASQQSGATWAIYEVMPVDRRGLFAGMTDEELQAWMPDPNVSAQTREQFLKDGKPAQPGDPAEHVEDGLYRRPLRDFMVIFREHNRLRALADDSIAAKTKDNELLAADLADAGQQQEFRRAEIAILTEELAHTTAERDLVKRIHDEYEAKLADFRRQVQEALDETRRLSAQWQSLQVEAARQIDEATAPQQASAVE